MFIVAIDVEKCKGCGDCVDACPAQQLAITEENGKKFVIYKGSPDDCLGCLSCQEGCPEGSITVTEL